MIKKELDLITSQVQVWEPETLYGLIKAGNTQYLFSRYRLDHGDPKIKIKCFPVFLGIGNSSSNQGPNSREEWLGPDNCWLALQTQRGQHSLKAFVFYCTLLLVKWSLIFLNMFILFYLQFPRCAQDISVWVFEAENDTLSSIPLERPSLPLIFKSNVFYFLKENVFSSFNPAAFNSFPKMWTFLPRVAYRLQEMSSQLQSYSVSCDWFAVFTQVSLQIYPWINFACSIKLTAFSDIAIHSFMGY